MRFPLILILAAWGLLARTGRSSAARTPPASRTRPTARLQFGPAKERGLEDGAAARQFVPVGRRRQDLPDRRREREALHHRPGPRYGTRSCGGAKRPGPASRCIERPPNGPVSATPATDGQNVYVFFAGFRPARLRARWQRAVAHAARDRSTIPSATAPLRSWRATRC